MSPRKSPLPVVHLTVEETNGELWFEPCRYDGSLVDTIDPATGAHSRAPHNARLNPLETRRVCAVLASARPALDFILVADDIENRCMIKTRGDASPATLAPLLFDLLVAGNWCLRTDDALAVASPAAIVGRPHGDPAIAPDYRFPPERVVVVASAAELAAAFGG